MKKFLRTILPAVLLMTFMGGSALAQNKIATVDLRKLFDNYYKTKLAQAAIQERASQLDKDDKSMRDDFNKANDDYQQLLAQENDQAISDDERDRRKQSAADKLKQLEDRKTAIDQYERQAQATLSDQRQRMRDSVLKEIQTAVSAKAQAEGYFLVFDTAAETVNNTAMVVYHGSENDLTDEILKQLNAGAPIDTTAPAVTIPTPSFMGTFTNSP
jgi:outer membrane protein